MIELFRRFDYRLARWKNGAGLSWEIVAEPRSATDPAMPFEWRLAIAEIEQDVAFSHYPGIDRATTLIEGAGLDLEIAGHAGVSTRGIGEPHWYPGDAATRCRLASGPVRVLNLMVRRELWAAEVVVAPADGLRGDRQAGDVELVFALDGLPTATAPQLGGPIALGRHDCALITGGESSSAVFAAAPGTRLYRARLTRRT